MQGSAKKPGCGTAGMLTLGALVLATIVKVVWTRAGTPPRSTLGSPAAQAHKQQEQKEAATGAAWFGSDGVLELEKEAWWLTETTGGAAEQPAHERADEDALKGSAGSAAGSARENDLNNGNEKENQKRNRQAGAKPNLFLILVDDMGWNDIGYQSMDMQAVTPNLNRMANSGIKLPHYYSQSLCTPARAALMTGRYPIRYGFQYSIIAPGAAWGLPLEEKLLPEYLNDHGYTCHMAGKWHLGGHTFDHMPQRRGFETSLAYTYGAETYWTHKLTPAGRFGDDRASTDGLDKFVDIGFGNGTGYYRLNGRPSLPQAPPTVDGVFVGHETVGIETDAVMTRASSVLSSSAAHASSSFAPSSPLLLAGDRKERYSTELFTTRTLEILKEKTPFDENPLFMYLAHQATHWPLGPPPADSFTAEEMSVLNALGEEETSERLSFAKVLMYLDKSIGRLMDYLDNEGWMENSIVVVASDNGGCPSHGGSNFPLRGVKSTNWEGGTKVPAFIYSPSHIPQELWGTEYKGLLHVTDWLPTLAAAAGIEISGSRGDLDGVSQWEHITGSFNPSFRNDGRGDVEGDDDDGRGSGGSDDGDGDGDVGLEGADRSGNRSGSSNSRRSSAHASVTGPRNEILYNYDPYFLGAKADHTPSDPDYAQAQGAFRQGKWKFLFKECCLGYDAFHPNASGAEENGPESNRNHHSQDNGIGEAAEEPDSYCYGCAEICVDKVDCKDWLFNLEEDPREEHNVAHIYPEVAQGLRDRVSSVVSREYSESLYLGADPEAFNFWKNEHNYWVVPWLRAGSQLREL